MTDYLWMIGFACGAGMVNARAGWGVMFCVSMFWLVIKHVNA